VLRELAGDASLLAWMNSVLGVGLIAGGVLLGIWGGFSKRIVTMLTGLMGMGGAVLALGLTPSSGVLVGLVSMFLVGLMAPLINGSAQAILQASVRPDFQGRVFTLMGSLSGAMAPVGLALAAPVADLVGVRAWYLASGILCAAMGILGFLIPAVLRIEENTPEAGRDSTGPTPAAVGAQSRSTG
jgi:DHA3 family macrolide efflux protein-like MFS transporter